MSDYITLLTYLKKEVNKRKIDNEEIKNILEDLFPMDIFQKEQGLSDNKIEQIKQLLEDNDKEISEVTNIIKEIKEIKHILSSENITEIKFEETIDGTLDSFDRNSLIDKVKKLKVYGINNSIIKKCIDNINEDEDEITSSTKQNINICLNNIFKQLIDSYKNNVIQTYIKYVHNYKKVLNFFGDHDLKVRATELEIYND